MSTLFYVKSILTVAQSCLSMTEVPPARRLQGSFGDGRGRTAVWQPTRRVPTVQRISIIGLGNMGEAIALRLLDGDFDVAVWNRTPGKAERVVKQGATEASDLAEAAAGVDVVISSLANDDAVRQIALARTDHLASSIS